MILYMDIRNLERGLISFSFDLDLLFLDFMKSEYKSLIEIGRRLKDEKPK